MFSHTQDSFVCDPDILNRLAAPGWSFAPPLILFPLYSPPHQNAITFYYTAWAAVQSLKVKKKYNYRFDSLRVGSSRLDGMKLLCIYNRCTFVFLFTFRLQLSKCSCFSSLLAVSGTWQQYECRQHKLCGRAKGAVWWTGAGCFTIRAAWWRIEAAWWTIEAAWWTIEAVWWKKRRCMVHVRRNLVRNRSLMHNAQWQGLTVVCLTSVRYLLGDSLAVFVLGDNRRPVVEQRQGEGDLAPTEWLFKCP